VPSFGGLGTEKPDGAPASRTTNRNLGEWIRKRGCLAATNFFGGGGKGPGGYRPLKRIKARKKEIKQKKKKKKGLGPKSRGTEHFE